MTGMTGMGVRGKVTVSSVGVKVTERTGVQPFNAGQGDRLQEI